MLIKNSEHIVTIEGYNSAGQGVSRIGGQVVFVKNAIRGEQCAILILKALKNVAYAKILEIIKPSPHRIEPACENFFKCGGCDFLHMDYTEELELKRLRVADALRRVGGFGLTVPPVVGSQLLAEYRNKAVFAVGYDALGLTKTAGFYREHSHDIIPAAHCLIQSDVSQRAAGAVIRWMKDNNITCYDEKTGKGAVRRIFCRNAYGKDAAQIVIVTADNCAGHTDSLIALILENCPECKSIVLNVNKERSNTVLAGRFRTIWGEGYITDELCGFEFRLSPRSFYQINHGQAEKIYEKAVSLANLQKDDTALDLYCGTGTITLVLSRAAGRVIGAEINADAVSDARENAQRNGVNNVEFISADASKAAIILKDSGITPAAVVVDPPRKGLSPEIIETICEMSPRRVVYVSCDPATLARDLALFNTQGYPPVSVEPYDMFPRCAHVECVSLLERA